MNYKNYYVGNIYLYYPDLKGNSNSKLIKTGIYKKRIDGTFIDIETKEKFYKTPRVLNPRGIFIDEKHLTNLSDYIAMLYSEGLIEDIKPKNIKDLTIL